MNRALLWLAAATVAASLVALSDGPDDDSRPGAPALVAASRRPWPPAAGARPAPVAARAGHAASSAAADLFAVTDLAPPPAAVAAGRPPQPPAPPPYTVTGSWQDGAATVVFVDFHGQSLTLCTACGQVGAFKPGATLPGGYRLQAIGPGSISLRRQPDGKTQTLEWLF